MQTAKVEKTIKKSALLIPSDYNLSCGEVSEIYKLSKQDLFYAIMYAFTYGFVKGTRAKAKDKVPVL